MLGVLLLVWMLTLSFLTVSKFLPLDRGCVIVTKMVAMGRASSQCFPRPLSVVRTCGEVAQGTAICRDLGRGSYF